MPNELLKLFTSAAGVSHDSTEKKILDAALHQAGASGVQKITMESIAKQANLNRTTIYRRFGSMENILAAMAIREGRRMIRALQEATEGLDEPQERFIEGFVAAIRFAREHPVITRTATYEPDYLIRSALANNAALLTLGGRFMGEAIRWAQSKGEATHLNADKAGDTASRLFATFVLMPGGINHLKDDRAARKYAKDIFAKMIFGPE